MATTATSTGTSTGTSAGTSTGTTPGRMAARPDVQAVIFDWGGTLTPWHSIDTAEPWRRYVQAYAASHPARPDPADLAGVLHEAELAAWRRQREEHSSARLDEVIRAAGLTPEGEAHERALSAWWEFWDPHGYTDPDAGPLFEALRARGIAVGVLSNTIWPRTEHERIFRRDGVLDLIDGAVYSSEIAWTKPHPEAFRAAAAAVSAVPDRCVFVGDRLFDDIQGAQAVGMRAVHVPHSDLPPEQIVDCDVEPDGVVQRLADLLPIIERWHHPA